MLAIRTILHPTDFSERSEQALELACALARDYDARLVLLHVAARPVVVYTEGFVPPAPQADIEALGEQLNWQRLPDCEVQAERRLEVGDAAKEIVRVAQEVHADLIVMGTHGRSGLGRLLLGSVAEQVLRKAPCPVLTVKSGPAPEATPQAAVFAKATSP